MKLSMLKMLGIPLVLICLAGTMASAHDAILAATDAAGCHVCTDIRQQGKNSLGNTAKIIHDWCESHGLHDGQRHCHLYAKNDLNKATGRNKVAAAFGLLGLFFRDKAAEDYRLDLGHATSYISLSENKQRLLIGASSADHSGHYLIKAGSEAQITHGLQTLRKKKIFDANFNQSDAAIFSASIDGTIYPIIFTNNDRLLLMNERDDVLCTGKVRPVRNVGSSLRDPHGKLVLACTDDFAKSVGRRIPSSEKFQQLVLTRQQ